MVPGLERANHTAWPTATQGRAGTALAHSDTKMALATYGRSLGAQRRKDGPSAPARTQQLARLRTTVLYHCWQRPMGYADDPMLVAKQTDGRSALGRSHLLNVTA